MPGSFVFKPLQANLIYDKDKIGSMDPYCVLTLGHHTAKTEVAQSEGVHPHWEDVISMERKHDESYVYVKLVDKDFGSQDDFIAEAKICLEAVEVKKRILQWYSVFDNGRLAGELLMDIEYVPEAVIPVQALVDDAVPAQVVVEKHTTYVNPPQSVVTQQRATTYVAPVVNQQTYVQPVQSVTQVSQHTYAQPVANQQSYVQPIAHVTQHTYAQPVVQQQSYVQPAVQQSYVQNYALAGGQTLQQSEVVQSRVQQYI